MKVNPKCVELAKFLLRDVKDARDEDVQELAEQFQSSAQAIIEAIEADVAQGEEDGVR